MRLRVCMAVTASALVAAPGAVGAFPGKNGLIAFHQTKTVPFKGGGQDIFVISPKGGKPRDVTRTLQMNEVSPSFSPDGRRIAFVWSRPGAAGSAKEPGGIGVVNVDGSGYRRLTTSDVNSLPYTSPSFTPDGKRIVYERQLSPAAVGVYPVGQAFWISASGGPQHQITSSDLSVVTDVLVSPLGTELAFGSRPSDYSAPGQLTVADIDGRNATSVGKDVQLSDWSPDGRRFAYFGPKLAVWTLPVTGGPAVEIGDGPGRDQDPVFSPDGRFIVWSNEFSHDLWIAGSSGGGAHDLAHVPGYALEPSWGPAGTR